MDDLTEHPTARFIEKLNEQMRFIERSCAAFDAGMEDEALRIAVAMRVVFHQSQSGTSLVAHLGLESSKMLSSSRGHGNFQDYLGHRIDLGSAVPIKMLPLFGEKFREMPLDDWWSKEPVFVHQNEPFTRRKIILSAANKDGGAHVDAQLERYYEVLRAGKYAIGITGALTYHGAPPFKQGITYYPKNAHFALIRQFGHEVLRSAAHWSIPQ
jgi:hypothetical protein